MTLASASDRSPAGCTSRRDTYRIQNSNPLAFASSQMRRSSTELASNPLHSGRRGEYSSRQRHLAFRSLRRSHRTRSNRRDDPAFQSERTTPGCLVPGLRRSRETDEVRCWPKADPGIIQRPSFSCGRHSSADAPTLDIATARVCLVTCNGTRRRVEYSPVGVRTSLAPTVDERPAISTGERTHMGLL